MGAYIIRRLLLIIPTLLGIMLINFALVQFVPGGPVEQAIARAQGGGDVFGGFAGMIEVGSTWRGRQQARGSAPCQSSCCGTPHACAIEQGLCRAAWHASCAMQGHLRASMHLLPQSHQAFTRAAKYIPYSRQKDKFMFLL